MFRADTCFCLCACMGVSVFLSVCMCVHALNTRICSASVVIGFMFPEARTKNDWNSPPSLCSSPALSLLSHTPFNSDYNSPSLPLAASHKDPIKKVIHIPAVWDTAMRFYRWWTVCCLSYFEFGFLSHAHSPFLSFRACASCAWVCNASTVPVAEERKITHIIAVKCQVSSAMYSSN